MVSPPACEVLDCQNRTLCLMEYGAVLEQSLRHRALAVFLRAGPRYVLYKTGDFYGFFHFSFLPAGLAGEDVVNELLSGFPELMGTAVKAAGCVAPEAATRNALVHLYLADLPRPAALGLAANTRDWLFLGPDELEALATDELLHPLLRHILQSGQFEKWTRKKK